MCKSEFDLVLVQEILGHGALNRLSIVQLEGEALHLGRSSCNIANLALKH